MTLELNHISLWWVQQRERSGERPFTGTYLDSKSVKQGSSKRALARALKLLNSPLASFLWDVGKQNSPWCDAALCDVPSGAILFAYIIFIGQWNKKWKITPEAPKNESGLVQMIAMGTSIRHKWVKVLSFSYTTSKDKTSKRPHIGTDSF